MTDTQIRPAVPDDASAIGAIHARTWQVAYQGLMPQEFLDRIDPERRADGWRRSLSEGRDRETTLVAEVDGKVIGFANVGPSRDDGAPSGEGEVRAVYVDPDHWDSGAGRALMIGGLEALRSAGFEDAVLWVLIDNERARRFYEGGSWVADGGTKTEESFGVQVTEVRYRRRLS